MFCPFLQRRRPVHFKCVYLFIFHFHIQVHFANLQAQQHAEDSIHDFDFRIRFDSQFFILTNIVMDNGGLGVNTVLNHWTKNKTKFAISPGNFVFIFRRSILYICMILSVCFWQTYSQRQELISVLLTMKCKIPLVPYWVCPCDYNCE